MGVKLDETKRTKLQQAAEKAGLDFSDAMVLYVALDTLKTELGIPNDDFWRMIRAMKNETNEPNKNSVWPEFSHLPEVCELDRFILENNIDVSKPAQILTNRILDEKIDLASNAVVAEQRKRRQE